jgi:hypothetical protein
VKLAIISVLAGAASLVAVASPWFEAAPVQRAFCVVVSSGGSNPPYVVVCPWRSSTT